MTQAAGALCWAAGLWTLFALARGGVVWTPAFALSLALLLRERGKPGPWRWTPERALLAALALYLSTFRWKGGDDIPASLIPLAILEHGTLALDAVASPWLDGKAGDFTVRHGEQLLSVYPVAAGVLASPLYLLPVLAGAPISETFLHNLSKTGGALLTAASVAVFLAAARRRCSGRWAALLTLVYAAGTWSFSVSSQALWQHGPAQLGAAIGLWGLFGRGRVADAAAGFGFSLACAARPDSAFLALAAAGALAWTRPRALPWAAAGAAVPAGLLAWYWLAYTGALRPPESAFQARIFGAFQPEALLALFASPTRGLMWFSPVALFGVRAGLRRGRPAEGPWLVAGVAATWVFLAHYGNWYGGMTFGTRYWATSCVALLLLCAHAEPVFSLGRAGKVFAGCAAFSIATHALGAYFNWPGRFDYEFERAHAWDALLHPWLDLLSAEGSLGALPAALRRAVFVAVAAGTYAIYRALKPKARP